MLIIGITVGLITGKSAEVSTALVESAKSGVNHAIGMAGVVAMWSGIMRLAEAEGLLDSLTSKMEGLIHFLFPYIPKGHPAEKYISLNFAANVLGLGWACTPAGLKAMEQLAELEKQRAGQGTEKGRQGSEDRRYGAEATAASNEMCTFLILNISSLQLIPVNMIAYRSQYGSANPAVIIAPALVATLFSTIIAIIYCKWKDR